MKVKQSSPDFKPIKITLETREEAQLFFDIIDKLDEKHCRLASEVKITKEEYKKVVIPLSDTLTNLECIIT